MGNGTIDPHRLHGLPIGIGCTSCAHLVEVWRQANRELLAAQEELRQIKEALPDLDSWLLRYREHQARLAK